MKDMLPVSRQEKQLRLEVTDIEKKIEEWKVVLRKVQGDIEHEQCLRVTAVKDLLVSEWFPELVSIGSIQHNTGEHYADVYWFPRGQDVIYILEGTKAYWGGCGPVRSLSQAVIQVADSISHKMSLIVSTECSEQLAAEVSP